MTFEEKCVRLENCSRYMREAARLFRQGLTHVVEIQATEPEGSTDVLVEPRELARSLFAIEGAVGVVEYCLEQLVHRPKPDFYEAVKAVQP